MLFRGVYFLADNKSRAVKVGYASDVRRRIKSIQTGNPHRLRLIGFLFDETMDTEKSFHECFKESRLSGEWFVLDAQNALTIVRRCQGWRQEFKARQQRESYQTNLTVNEQKIREVKRSFMKVVNSRYPHLNLSQMSLIRLISTKDVFLRRAIFDYDADMKRLTKTKSNPHGRRI